MTRRVIGVDPGGTSGLVVVAFDDQTIDIEIAAELGEQAVFLYLHRLLNETDTPILAIAIERYTITARTLKLTRQNEALEIIGAAKALALTHGGAVRVEEYEPSAAKTAWPNSRLAEYGLSVKGGHAKDALRHAMLYVQLKFPQLVVR